MIKNQMRQYRGVATKYMNRYLSLFVFVRRFLDMDDNEKLPLFIKNLKTMHIQVTRKYLRESNLVQSYS